MMHVAHSYSCLYSLKGWDVTSIAESRSGATRSSLLWLGSSVKKLRDTIGLPQVAF